MNDTAAPSYEKHHALLLATRPKTLAISVVPVVVSTLLAYSLGVKIDWEIAFFLLLTALSVQIGTNFVNDALDFKKGADDPYSLGPFRATKSGKVSHREMMQWSVVAFALGAFFCIPLILQGGWSITLLLIVSILSGYLYTGGPKPLAYCGLGEVFAFLFFGVAITGASYYLQTGYLDLKALLVGVQIGCLETAILAINNLRDYHGDARVHKRTLAVRFGQKFAKMEITLLLLFPFALCLLWFYYSYFFVAILPLSVIALAIDLIGNIRRYEPSALYNQFLYKGAALHLSFGLLMGVGFWLQKSV
jgi:1,4-dihydroxy-2-naphthoate octaprenyltransferase